MGEVDARTPPPRMPGELIVQLVEAFNRGPSRVLPMCHALDVLPLLQGDDREYAVATQLLNAGRVFYPIGMEPG
ncbi:hypothetical protein ACWIGI_11225 [Nocardia sp. NPDC055321]